MLRDIIKAKDKGEESGLNLTTREIALGRKRRREGGFTFPVRGLDPEVWRRFRVMCVELGVSANYQMLLLVHAWVEDEGVRKGVRAYGTRE